MEWVRLKDNPKIKKLQDILLRLSDFYPSKESPKFDKYPYKWKSGENGVESTSEYWCKSEVEVFFDRVLNKFLSNNKHNLVIFSDFEKEEWKYVSSRVRKNTLIYITNIRYANSMHGKYIVIDGIDINSNRISLKYNVYNLTSIVYKIIEDTSFFDFTLTDIPTPCYECIKVTKDTSYNQYKAYCKKYNFKKLLTKSIFDKLSFTDYNSNKTINLYFDKEGKFIDWNSDYKIINE